MIPKFKVYTYCSSYNHSKYIKDTLNGFCMQKTNFPFVCAIKDDASTDGEPEIIRQYLEDNFDFTDSSVAYKKETEYGNVLFAQHKDNKNCYFAVVLLKENHYSQKKDVRPYFQEWRDGVPYLALCEGDDYWIDSHKLQKQVEYMDEHPECSLCFHNAVIFWENENKQSTIFNSLVRDQDVTVRQIVTKWIIPTASIVCRPERVIRPAWANKIYSGDLTMALLAASTGTVHSMRNVMSVYRKNEGSVSATVDKDSNGFRFRQQLLLYDEFNKYTNNKFEDDIRPKYEMLLRKIRHIERKKKNCLTKFYSYFIFYFQKYILKNVW